MICWILLFSFISSSSSANYEQGYSIQEMLDSEIFIVSISHSNDKLGSGVFEIWYALEG